MLNGVVIMDSMKKVKSVKQIHRHEHVEEIFQQMLQQQQKEHILRHGVKMDGHQVD
jgi:hypothetical protein